jgi:short-subunit dehydrogenase
MNYFKEKKQLYYSVTKSGLISFKSGSRQNFFNYNINIITIILGYMLIRSFREENWNSISFLITKTKKVELIIKESVDKKKEIIYINIFWKLINKILNCFPEKIYKRFLF